MYQKPSSTVASMPPFFSKQGHEVSNFTQFNVDTHSELRKIDSLISCEVLRDPRIAGVYS